MRTGVMAELLDLTLWFRIGNELFGKKEQKKSLARSSKRRKWNRANCQRNNGTFPGTSGYLQIGRAGTKQENDLVLVTSDLRAKSFLVRSHPGHLKTLSGKSFKSSLVYTQLTSRVK